MATGRAVKRRSKKAGLPPGTLIHIGERKTEKTRITIIDYDEARVDEREATSPDECAPYKETPTVTWINVEGIHEPEVMARLGELYGLHPLILEDILNTDQRPKMDDFGDYLYVVLKMLSQGEKADQILVEQVSLVLGRNFVISFQEGGGDVFGPIRERIRSAKGRIRKEGPDYLAYTLIDAIVDQYFAILEKLGESIEQVEEALLERPSPEISRGVHALRREMIFLHKSVWPLREVISGLERGGSPLLRQTTALYLRDVYDHIIQVIDTIETYRDMIAGMLDVYLSSLSYRMNEVMKVLTIIATIFIPLTFLAGVWGMNFDVMPELRWPWGYAVAWTVMLAIGIVMLVAFKRKKWF
jgi:magnesium transporter